jgi:hypothetical protein
VGFDVVREKRRGARFLFSLVSHSRVISISFN